MLSSTLGTFQRWQYNDKTSHNLSLGLVNEVVVGLGSQGLTEFLSAV